MRQLTKVADNIVALLVRQMLTWSLTAILMIFFLPRLLGDVGLGKITFAVALITMLLVVTNLGTATFTVKQVALDRRRLSDLLWSAYAIRLTMGLLVGGIVVLSVHLSPLDGDSKGVLTVASLTLIVMGLDAAQIAALQGLENMRWIALAEVAGKSTLLIVGITVLVTGHGVVAYALAMLVGALVGFLVNLSYLARRHLRRPSLSPAAARYLLVGGFPFLMTGAIMQFYTWSATVMLRVMTWDAVVGWFGAATQLYTTMNFIPLVIITAMLPALTRFHVEDRETMRVAVEKGMLAVLTTAVPVAAACVLLSGDLIGFLRYPSEFQNSIPLLSILALTLPVTGSLMLVGTVVIAADKQKEWAITMGITSIISVALDVPLIVLCERAYGNGAIGVAISTVLSESIMMALGIRLIPRGVLGRPVLLALVRSVTASLAMLAAMGAAKLLFAPGFVPLALLGAPVYFAALLAVRGVTVGELKFLIGAALSKGRAPEELSLRGGGPSLVPELEREGA
jgi:O-antigen/teichoic acid export membrane protein